MGVDRAPADDDSVTEVEKEIDLCAQTIRDFVQHPIFDAIIIITVVVNTVLMAVIGPEPEEGSAEADVTYWAIIFCCVLYTFEMLLKMWGLGLWRNEQSYFMDGWCRFDFLCVVASWLDLVLLLLDESQGKLVVARLVRMCRVIRFLKGTVRFESSRTTVLVVLTTLANCKWVLMVLIGFILCVVTLWLNWFGSEMRYKCALVEGLLDGAGESISLSQEDRAQLELGKAWDLVTSLPYRLQVPLRFCRHTTRPGPAGYGQRCNEEDGMMCVFINEPPFDGLMGFENFGTAVLTVLLIIFQQQFDDVVLSTMQATVQVSSVLFASIMVLGGFFLLEYITAILCITYAEISSTHEDLADTRVSPEQLLLQITHTETHANAGEISANGVTESNTEPPSKGLRKNVTIDDLQAGADSAWTDRFWSMTKRKYKDWSRREPKTKDVLSFPLLNYYGEVNVEAIERIRKRARETVREDSTFVRWMRVGFDTTSYVLAGAIQFPTPASEMYGARGWQGSNDKGAVSLWEWIFTAFAVMEVANQIVVSTARIWSRQNGVELPLEQSYSGLTWILWVLFVCDMAIKIVAFKGPLNYLQTSLNQVDATVTIVQFCGMITWKHPNLGGLRIVRLIAILAIDRKFSSLHIVVGKTFGSTADTCMSIWLSFLIICAFAVFGQQTYGGASLTNSPRSYYGTFYFSLMSIIEISSNGGMLDMIKQGLTVGPYTVIFLFLSQIIINLLVMRLMIPFMLRKYEEPDAFKVRYQIFFGQVVKDGRPMWEHQRQHARLLTFFRLHQSDDHVPEDFFAAAEEENRKAILMESVTEAHSLSTLIPFKHRVSTPLTDAERTGDSSNATKSPDVESPDIKELPTLAESPKVLSSKSINGAVHAWHAYGHLMMLGNDNDEDFKKNFKRAFAFVARSLWYEPLVSVLVVASCYVFNTSQAWGLPEWIWTTVKCALLGFFQCEMVLLIWISYGKSLSKTPYHKDPWRIFEMIAIVGMWDVIIPVLPNARGIANLRFFQLARALRAMSVIPDIQLAYERLASLSVNFFHCLTLIACLMVGFTTLSMPLFGGLFFSCDDASAADRGTCSGTYYSRAGSPEDEIYILRYRAWETPPENFDSFWNALGTSFTLFLNTGWSEVISNAMSVTAAGVQPLQYGTGVMGLLLVAYQILAMVLRQLLIAVVISNLRESSGSGLQTDDQKAFIATQRMCESKCAAYRASRGSTGSSGWSVAKDIKRHPAFRTVIEITIIINIVTMLCVSYGASKTQEDIMQSINAACLLVYYIEMITVLLADVHLFFLNGWNVFDGIINIISTLDLYYWYTNVDNNADSIEIMSLRSARVLRLVKLAGRSQQISILLHFSAKAFRTSIGCYLVWCLLMVLFAIPASMMFSHIRQTDSIDPTTYSNFDDFGMSLLFLFRIAVQNNFVYPVSDLGIQKPYCTSTNYTLIETSSDQTGNGDCGTDIVSVWIFFSCFQALSRLVIVPFIAGCVVFTFFETMDELRSVLSKDEVAKFEEVWFSLDRNGTGYIAEWKLPSLLQRMRSSMHPLWFDAEKHPDKQDLFEEMIKDEMEAVRNDLKEKIESSIFSRLKYETDLGLKPGQIRYDSLLKTLTALKRFGRAMQVPPTEQYRKLDQICIDTFCETQSKHMGAIHRQTVLAKRANQVKATRLQDGGASTNKGMSQKSGQMEPQTKEPKKKEGLQPLTIENVKEFHEEEESWEDPKDFALRTQCGEEGLPAQMRKMSKDPPSDIEHWITQHEKRGVASFYSQDGDVWETKSATSRRTGTNTHAQTREGQEGKSAMSVRSDLDEAKWRVNQGKWSDVGSSEDDAASTHNLPTMRFASNPAPATLGSHATANIFFDTTWEELSGDKDLDLAIFLDQLKGDIAFSLHVPDNAVDVVSFDKAKVCAEVHLHPSSSGRTPASVRGPIGDSMRLAENLKNQALDEQSDLRTLQPDVSRAEITPPTQSKQIDFLQNDSISIETPPQIQHLFDFVGAVGRGLLH